MARLEKRQALVHGSWENVGHGLYSAELAGFQPHPPPSLPDGKYHLLLLKVRPGRLFLKICTPKGSP